MAGSLSKQKHDGIQCHFLAMEVLQQLLLMLFKWTQEAVEVA